MYTERIDLDNGRLICYLHKTASNSMLKRESTLLMSLSFLSRYPLKVRHVCSIQRRSKEPYVTDYGGLFSSLVVFHKDLHKIIVY